MLKRTPLFQAHQELGARLVEFGGWEMPVQYSSIMDEHQTVRSAAGMFDISHMGEVLVKGPAALAFLNHLLTNDLGRLSPGQGQYTLMCNERGGVIDDLYAYCLAPETYLLIINASRIDADVAWIHAQHAASPVKDQVSIENISDCMGAIALQGPKVAAFIDACFPARTTGGTPVTKISDLKKNEVTRSEFDGEPLWIARTGYTGEDGFEIVAPSSKIEGIWRHVLAVGQPFGLKPAGLGARDTLRTEMCYPLYGHELDENTSPIEAGIGFFVAFGKGDFVGRSVLESQKANGPAKKCVAFKMVDKSAPPRPHYPVWSAGPEGRKVGEVVSGTLSPSLNLGIGLGYVPPELAKPGTPLEIEIRGRRSAAVVVAKPLFKKPV